MVHATEVQAVTMFHLFPPAPYTSAPTPALLQQLIKRRIKPYAKQATNHWPLSVAIRALYIVCLCCVTASVREGEGRGYGTGVCGFCCVSMGLVNFRSTLAAAVTVTGASRCFRLCSCLYPSTIETGHFFCFCSPVFWLFTVCLIAQLCVYI